MAVVHNPLISTEARGKVGGMIWNTWRGRAYVKSKTAPAQPRSQRQLNIRAISTMLIRKWQTLGATIIGNWNDYARDHPDIDWSGNPKRLTGANWYLRCNLRLLDNGYPATQTPPATAAPAAPASFAAGDGTSQSILTWTAMPGTDTIAEIWMFGPHSPGIQAKIVRARRKSAETGESGTTTITGLIPGTHTFFLRIIKEADGLTSPWKQDTAVITAT